MAINILQTPAPGTVVLDANNTVIKVQSTNGAGYYFRALIYIGGVLFDEQGWSRSDDFTAVADLKKLYSAYFEPQFIPVFDNALTEQSHLMREVSITVKEYSLTTGAEIQSLALPSFFIMYNIKPVSFNAQMGLVFLGMTTPNIRVPADGKIILPFYVGSPGTNVTVTLTDNNDTVMDVMSAPIGSGKKVFLYQFDLSGTALGNDITNLLATVRINDAAITIRFRIIRLPFYEIKEMAFLNNFGFYLRAYFSGQMKIENAFSPETDVLSDEREIISEINEDATYTMHTGVLKESEGGIVNMVANSPDTRLYVNGKWISLVTDTKKQTEHQDKLHLYGESLVFTLRKGTDIENVNYIYTAPLPDIVIESGIKTSDRHYTLTYRLNNGFIPASGYLRLRMKLGTNSWSTLSLIHI